MSRYIDIKVFRKTTQNFGFVSTGNYDYDCGYNECMSVLERDMRKEDERK